MTTIMHSIATPPVSGYNETPPVVSTLNRTTLTHDYSEEVAWSADSVVNYDTKFDAQGLSREMETMTMCVSCI